MQHTLTNSVIFKGHGLHTGAPVTMTVSPAMEDEGIRFIRKDVDDVNNEILARYDNVEPSQLCTKIRNDDGVEVSTIEHVMAALAGCGIDNATLILDGPEVPIMDGSSMPFVRDFQAIGIQPLNKKRQAIRILKPIEVHGEDGAFARFIPDTESVFEFTIDFKNEFIGHQKHEFTLDNHDSFRKELADCPTFTTMDEVEKLRSFGLIQGGDETNADVYMSDRIHRNGQKRDNYENAAVRHKILDAIGDCALAGMPIIGRYEGYKSGHGLTNALLRTLFADDRAFVIVTDELGTAQPAPENQSHTTKLAYNA